MEEESNHCEDIKKKITNAYACNNRNSKYMEEKQIKLQEEIGKHSVIVGSSNTILS